MIKRGVMSGRTKSPGRSIAWDLGDVLPATPPSSGRQPGGEAHQRSWGREANAIGFETGRFGGRDLGICRAAFPVGPDSEQTDQSSRTGQSRLACDPQRRAASARSAPCSRTPWTLSSSPGQAKSAIGKRNKTGRITLCVQKNVPADPAPIEIFDNVAYRLDYVRIIVFEYLLDRVGTLLLIQ
jgi:hypothetical protein